MPVWASTSYCPGPGIASIGSTSCGEGSRAARVWAGPERLALRGRKPGPRQVGMRTSSGCAGTPDRGPRPDRSTVPFWRGEGMTPPLAVLPGSPPRFGAEALAARALGTSGGQMGGVRSVPTNVQSSSGYLERRPAISAWTLSMRARMADSMLARSGSTGYCASSSLAEGGACHGGRKSSGGCMTGACDAQVAAGDMPTTGGEGRLTYSIGCRLTYSIGGFMSYSAG
eukprot:scaffold15946_cov45-Phaeocystis_antarctica.AAC.3